MDSCEALELEYPYAHAIGNIRAIIGADWIKPKKKVKQVQSVLAELDQRVLERCAGGKDINAPTMPGGQPLTLEQLREMNGRCVKVIVDGIEPLEMLALVEAPEDEDCVLLRNNLGGVSEFYSDDDLREDGVKVYAYPPARIDREAWEPCGRCEEKDCSNCAYGDDPEGRSHCKNCEGESWWRSEWTPYYDFCPWCGRPMTEHAWAKLEKRVEASKY